MIAFASVKKFGNGKSVVFSDFTLDRVGEQLRPEGVDLTNFKKYAPMLIGHNYGSLPIGKWVNTRVENAQIIGDPFFAKTERAKEVEQLIADDCAPAVSVGLQVIERNKENNNIIDKWELMEVSWVAVPANPNALMRMLEKGFSFEMNSPADVEKAKKSIDTLKQYREFMSKMNVLTQLVTKGEKIEESAQLAHAIDFVTKTLKELETLKAQKPSIQKATPTVQATPEYDEKMLEDFKTTFKSELKNVMTNFTI